jgi:hypothetical protein
MISLTKEIERINSQKSEMGILPLADMLQEQFGEAKGSRLPSDRKLQFPKRTL